MSDRISAAQLAAAVDAVSRAVYDLAQNGVSTLDVNVGVVANGVMRVSLTDAIKIALEAASAEAGGEAEAATRLLETMLRMDSDVHLHRRASDVDDADPDLPSNVCVECESLWPCYVERARALVGSEKEADYG